MLTKKQINNIYNLILLYYDISNKSRKEGLLSIEEEIDKIKSFSNHGYNLMKLVLDGTDSEFIDIIHNNYIKNNKSIFNIKYNYIINNIIRLCTTYIQSGSNMYTLQKILKSLFSDKFLKKYTYFNDLFNDELYTNFKRDDYIKDKDVYQFLRLLVETDSDEMMNIFKLLDDTTIQKIMRYLSDDEISYSLAYTTLSIKLVFISNMSPSLGKKILEQTHQIEKKDKSSYDMIIVDKIENARKHLFKITYKQLDSDLNNDKMINYIKSEILKKLDESSAVMESE
jgi:DNA-binding transcriptional ArsR family regulator